MKKFTGSYVINITTFIVYFWKILPSLGSNMPKLLPYIMWLPSCLVKIWFWSPLFETLQEIAWGLSSGSFQKSNHFYRLQATVLTYPSLNTVIWSVLKSTVDFLLKNSIQNVHSLWLINDIAVFSKIFPLTMFRILVFKSFYLQSFLF